MNLMLWLEEDEEQQMKKDEKEKENQEALKCACGRAVCCGKHKKGQCSCQNQKRERE